MTTGQRHLMGVAISTLAAIASCGRSTVSRTQHIQIDGLGYDLDESWRKANVSEQRGVVTAVFVPDGDNTDKESVTVIRTRRSPAVAKAGLQTVADLLAVAEPTSRRDSIERVTTPAGFAGAKVELDFQPPTIRATYHRVHVVLVDGVDLIHVMYTALRPDHMPTVFEGVLRTIHHEDA